MLVNQNFYPFFENFYQKMLEIKSEKRPSKASDRSQTIHIIIDPQNSFYIIDRKVFQAKLLLLIPLTNTRSEKEARRSLYQYDTRIDLGSE